MLPIKTVACAAAALGLMTATAHAEDSSRWFVHVGPAYVDPIEHGTVSMGGAVVPGGDVAISGRFTGEVEAGYFVTKNIAIAAAAGFPPKFSVEAAGSLAGLGTSGKVTGGPAGVMIQYHANRGGRIQPYVGVGAAFLLVLGTEDGLLTNFKSSSDVGPAIGGGVDFMLNNKWGLFIDAKKAWVSTKSTGMLGPNPVVANVDVNPMVYNAGLAYHF